MNAQKRFPKILLLFISIFIMEMSFAQEKEIVDYNFESSIVLQNTVVDELVFEHDTLLSKLIWKQNIDPAIRLTYNARLNSIFFMAQGSISIPLQSGTLKDYDYINFTDVITHYSEHDLFLIRNLSLKLQAAYMFSLHDIYSIKPVVGVNVQNRKFGARDGFTQYPDIEGDPWTSSIDKTPLHGTVITYDQTILYPYVGLENVFSFDVLTASLHALYFPYMIVNALDDHVLRSTQFYDAMRGGYGFLVGTAVRFPFGKESDFGLKLGFDYEFFKCYGTTSTQVNNTGFVLSSNASSGTKSSVLSVTVGIVFNPNFWM